MKKRILSVIAMGAISLAAFSCSSDDETPAVEQNKLLGKWSYVQEVAVDANGNVVSSNNENNGMCPLDIFEFKENNALQQTDYDHSSNASECNGDNINGTYNLNGSNFKLTFSNDEESFEVKKLTAELFEIQRPLNRGEEGDYELNVVALKYVFEKKD